MTKLNLQPGGRRKENQEGLHWENPDNPYNGTDDEEGGDEYEAYEQGMYYEEDEDDNEDD